MSVVRHISNSLQGLTHIENQDGYLIIDEAGYYLLAVFDGVSRARNPRKGVELAIQFVRQKHRLFIGNNTIQLNELMYAANQDLLNANIPEPLTTYAIAGFFKENSTEIYYSNLGDSRIYHIKDKDSFQLTVDHTMWPGSHILTKCLGDKYLVAEDFTAERYQAEKGFLFLATDGCYGFWEENQTELLRVLNNSDLERFQTQFTRLIEGQNFDDATYIFIKIG